MHTLSIQDTQQIAGGVQQYVTEDWKSSCANKAGVIAGSLLGVMCFSCCVCVSIGFLPATVSAASAAIGGYIYTHEMVSYQNSLLKNDTWYDIQQVGFWEQRAA